MGRFHKLAFGATPTRGGDTSRLNRRALAVLAGLFCLGSIAMELRPHSDAPVATHAAVVPDPAQPTTAAADPAQGAGGERRPAVAAVGVAPDVSSPTVAQAAGDPAAANTVTDAAEPAPPSRPLPARMIEAHPGDTLSSLLTRMGVAPEDTRSAIGALSTVWQPRELRAGQKLALFTQSDRLHSLRLATAPDHDVVVARNDSGAFVAEDQVRPVNWVPTIGTGRIRTSLSAAASEAGVPMSVLGEMIRAFSYDVDFQREVKPGDTFTVLFDRVYDEYGQATGTGQLFYAEMVLSGVRLRLYRFAPSSGEPGYYTALGYDIRKPLLRTPIDGARLTSGFGMRFHPILGYSRMHRGVDFGAAIGTPVFAAGDGVVVKAGPASGYGNYIEIEHNREYATAYGHLSGYAHGLHPGERVRQGEVIGYVGMTGLATGPHLHYEVHIRGEQTDPQTVKMPAITRLAGKELRAFEGVRNAIERQLLELRQDLIARAGSQGPTLLAAFR